MVKSGLLKVRIFHSFGLLTVTAVSVTQNFLLSTREYCQILAHLISEQGERVVGEAVN